MIVPVRTPDLPMASPKEPQSALINLWRRGGYWVKHRRDTLGGELLPYLVVSEDGTLCLPFETFVEAQDYVLSRLNEAGS